MIGGLVASIYIPKPKLISTLQHFVAGVVIAAVSIELLPKIIHKNSSWTVVCGFVLGAVVMLLLNVVTKHLSKGKGASKGLITGGALDLLIDGILIGVSFLAGKESGLLIVFSLSLCAFFLNLTVASTLRQKGVRPREAGLMVFLIAAMLPLGAWIGGSVLAHLPESVLTETIAFGVAALLYLGVEELLSEAHEKRDTIWVSASFFLGFLAILLIG